MSDRLSGHGSPRWRRASSACAPSRRVRRSLDDRAQLRERAAQLAANLPPEAQPNAKPVYRTTDQGKPLSIWVYWPGGKKPDHPLPAIVLYHGGGWTTGTPVFYLAVARHFVERGMIALLPEYRVNESSGSKIPDSTQGRARRHALGEGPCRRAGHRSEAPRGWRRIGRRAAAPHRSAPRRWTIRTSRRSILGPKRLVLFNPGRATSPIPPSRPRA